MTEFNFDIDLESIEKDYKRITQKPEDRKVVNQVFVQFPEREGFVIARLLPPAPGAKFYETCRTHYINNKTLYCPMEFVGEKWRGECPACKKYHELFEEAKRAKTKDDIKTLQSRGRFFKPNEKNYFNCIVREEIDPETKQVKHNLLKVLPCGKKLQQRVLRAIYGDEVAGEARLGNVAHPVTGRDLKIVKRISKSPRDDGSGFNEWANYDESKFLEPSHLGTKDQIQEWLSQMHDLRSFVVNKAKSYEEIQHEVDVSLGLAQDDDVQFNVDRLDGGTLEVTMPTHSASSEKVLIDPVVMDDFGGVEDEFIRELQASLKR